MSTSSSEESIVSPSSPLCREEISTISHEDFNKICHMTDVRPFVSTTRDGHKVVYMAKSTVPSGVPFIRNASRGIMKWNSCRECASRYKKLGPLIDQVGPIFHRHITSDDHIVERKIKKCTRKVFSELTTKKKGVGFKPYHHYLGFEMVREHIPYPKELGRDPERDFVPFEHYSITYPDISDAGDHLDPLESAFNKYYRLIGDLLMKVDDISAIIKSLEMLIDILKEVTYGKALLPGAKWLLSAIEKLPDVYVNLGWRHTIQIVGDIVCESTISNDIQGYVITSFHQANRTIMTLLEDATGYEAMKSMVEEMVKPTVYKRPTAPPSKGQVAVGSALLGPFENKIYTLDRLWDDYSTKFKTHSTPGGDFYCTLIPLSSRSVPVTSGGGASAGASAVMDAYAQMAQAAKKPSRYDFASRTTKSLRPTTYRELVGLIEEGKIHTLDIDTSSAGSWVYIAETTLDYPTKIATPYLWSFSSGTSRWPAKARVTFLQETKVKSLHNIAILLEDTRTSLQKRSITENCCFPDFLSTSHERTCRRVFEDINKRVPIGIPDGSDELAIGVGTSIRSSAMDLHTTLRFYINRSMTPISISKY